ncbi:MAG TPA: coproporphyrinogen III oxidase family protein, partial [Pirellulales bacterium]|nr:coproporphyrinogen III oxidase family protein [Pirellulales bacterium]
GAAFWGRLQRGDLRQADEELERAMYAEAIERLTAAGFEHYEVSNFARLGRRCRHNEHYWAAREYYAAGPGAARYLDGRREVNHRSTTAWMQRVLGGQSPVAEHEELSPEDRAREALVLGLRRLEGVARGEFRRQTGFEVEALMGAELGRLVKLGMLSDGGERVRLTRQGLFVSDSIWSSFLRC